MLGFDLYRSFSGLVSLQSPFVDYLFFDALGEGVYKRPVAALDGGFPASKYLNLFEGCLRDSTGLDQFLDVIYPAPNAIFSCLLPFIDRSSNPNIRSFSPLVKMKRRNGQGDFSDLDKERLFYNIVSKFSRGNRSIGYLIAGLIDSGNWNNAFLSLARFIIVNEMVNYYIDSGDNISFKDMLDGKYSHILQKSYENYHSLKFKLNDYSLLLADVFIAPVPKNINNLKRFPRGNDLGAYRTIRLFLKNREPLAIDSETLTVGRSFVDINSIPEMLCTDNLIDIYDKLGRVNYSFPYKNKCYLTSNHVKIFTRESLRDQGIMTADFNKLPLKNSDGVLFNQYISQVENVALATDKFIFDNNLTDYSNVVYSVARNARKLGLNGIKRQYALFFILIVESESMKKGSKVNENTIKTILETFLASFRSTFITIEEVENIANIYAQSHGSIPLSYIVSSVKK